MTNETYILKLLHFCRKSSTETRNIATNPNYSLICGSKRYIFELKKSEYKYFYKILNQEKMNKQRISIMCQEDTYFIDLEKIIRCETVKNFTNIYFIDGTIKTLPCSINKGEEEINNKVFFRTNDNHLINTNFMKFIKKQEDEIEMINGQEVPVLKRNKEEILEFLRSEMAFIE